MRPRPLLPIVTRSAILDQIEDKVEQLPSLPQATQRILQLMGDPDASVSDMEEVVSRAPVMAARVLRLSKSSFYGQREVHTLSRAIIVIGFRTVGSLALATSTYTLLSGVMSAYGMTSSGLWQHSLAGATVASRLARRFRVQGEVHTPALLHDIGKLLLAPHLADRAITFRQRAETGQDTDQIERDLLGVGHTQAGTLIATKWDLPAAVLAVIRDHHDPNPQGEHAQIIGVVRAADALVRRWGVGLSRPPAVITDDWPELSVLGVPRDERAALLGEFDQARDEVVQLCKLW